MILGGSLTPAGELYRDNKPDFAFSRVNEVIPSWTAKAVELNDPEVISGTGVKLQWSDNNYGLVDQFIIERKINDGNYTEIGRVAQNATYEFIDTDWSKSAGTVRYRVKTLLKTNKNLYSREISVHTLTSTKPQLSQRTGYSYS